MKYMRRLNSVNVAKYDLIQLIFMENKTGEPKRVGWSHAHAR